MVAIAQYVQQICKKATMLRSKRPRLTAQKYHLSQGRPEAGAEKHWADVWLPRLSHVAQFGLFVFMLGSLYFTVIPLYQKALLDEAIAKKEVELTTITKTVDHLYLGIRRYVVRDFYIQAMPACGSLFAINKSQNGKEEPSESKQTRAEIIYAIDMPVCFNKLLGETKSLNELRDADRQVFGQAVVQMASDLVKKRSLSMAKYKAAPSDVIEKDLYSLPRDSFRVRALEQIEKWKGGAIDRDARRKLAAAIAQDKIVSDYEGSIRDGVLALKDAKWVIPAETSK